jgi:hypothetical protein
MKTNKKISKSKFKTPKVNSHGEVIEIYGAVVASRPRKIKKGEILGKLKLK